MIEQAITITANEILIKAQFFIHKDFSVTKRDVILDILGQYYAGQQIRIQLFDGENLKFSGFAEFILFVCNQFNIPHDKIVVESHNPNEVAEFKLDLLKLGIFISVNQYLTPIDTNRTGARFVGCLLGRYNINRLRLAYELDQAFTNDTYITYQPNPQFVANDLKHVNTFYTKELEWLQTKQFDKDMTSPHPMGMIGWYASCANYRNVWNKYEIEVVSETDSMSNFWFTEKTANCLATGKPFVLVAGTGSLQRLRDMGFQTFGTVLDESYDLAKHPYERIKRLTASLTMLYNSPSRSQHIGELYSIANQNIELYNKYIQTI